MQKIVKLHFKSPLHIGMGKPDFLAVSNSVLHSDTIKAALFSTAKKLSLNLGEDFWNSFIVSSSMPFFKDVLFLPKPNFSNINFKIFDGKNTINGGDLKFHKLIKKTAYIEKSLFEKFNSGQIQIINDYQFSGNLLWDNDTLEKIFQEKLSVSEKIQFNQKGIQEYKHRIIKRNLTKLELYKKTAQERVKIYNIPIEEDNEFITSRPYNIERIYFKEECGLYFIIEYEDDEVVEIIKKALNTLQDIGFGTDKSVGNGQFENKLEDFSISTPTKSDFRMNLSLFLPKEVNDFKNNVHRYQLIERGGYIESHNQSIGILKNTVNMVSEGSVFKNSLSENGKYIDVNPGKIPLKEDIVEIEHPVWREGRSIFIPLNFSLKQ